MAACPKGHESAAADYCDVCGAPMGAPSIAAPPLVPATTAEPVAAGPPCPECGTPSAGRFCEVCGHDFVTAALAPPAPLAGGPAAIPQPPAGSTPAAESSPTNGSVAAASGWVLIATADREYHQRMQAVAGPDAEPVAFPAFCPQRRFLLQGEQLLIGRRSRSRGVEPDIDLTGPPEDAGVSHTHALVVAQAGGWAVVDLDSANGTYVGDSTDPIAANTPVPLAAGDQFHVGAWTTLTLQPA